jgi:enoyl-CoA hydratase
VRIGIPSVVEAALLPRLVGAGRARNLVLTGEMIDAPTALAWGLVDAVGDPDSEVERLAAPILDSGPRAIRIQKALVLDWEEAATTSEAVRRGIDRFVEAFDTDEPHRMAAQRLAAMRARKSR